MCVYILPLIVQNMLSYLSQWSYGIVMWEIFSLADTPYPEVPNGSVISHLMLDERLPQPHDCPDEM